MRENVREWIKAVLTAVVVAVIAIQFVVPTTVYGVSMEPTFENNDYLLTRDLVQLRTQSAAGGCNRVLFSFERREWGKQKTDQAGHRGSRRDRGGRERESIHKW